MSAAPLIDTHNKNTSSVTTVDANSKRIEKKTTFECTLRHPVDLSSCRGSQQAVESRKQQRYEQQQHGVRTSDPPLRDDDNKQTDRRHAERVGRGCRGAEDESGRQRLQLPVIWLLSAIASCLPPPDSLGSPPHCGAGHLSASSLGGTIGAGSAPQYI